MGCGASTTGKTSPVPDRESAITARAEPAQEADAAAVSNGAGATDVAATKAKTRGALLGGLKSGALEAAVAKMEEDTAAEEEAAAAAAAQENDVEEG